MGWADGYIAALERGETIEFRPRGDSMHPRISSGQLVKVEPVAGVEAVSVGDMVLCTVGRSQYLHLVKAKDQQGRAQIANNKGFVNGWTSRIHGRVVQVG